MEGKVMLEGISDRGRDRYPHAAAMLSRYLMPLLIVYWSSLASTNALCGAFLWGVLRQFLRQSLDFTSIC